MIWGYHHFRKHPTSDLVIFRALAFASQKTDCGRSLTLGAAALSGAAEAKWETVGPVLGRGSVGVPHVGKFTWLQFVTLITWALGKRLIISFYRCKRHLNKRSRWFEAHFPKWVGWIWCGLFLGGFVLFVLSDDVRRSHRIILVAWFLATRIWGSDSLG